MKYTDQYWELSRPLRAAIQYIEDAAKRGEGLRIIFEVEEGKEKFHLQVEDKDNIYLCAYTAFSTFEDALIHAGNSIGEEYASQRVTP